MKIFAKLAKELFESGRAIGFKTNITEATGWLRGHSKGIGEELGNALSGKGKKINNLLIKFDLYDKFFAHLDDVAKQYPDATVEVAAKNAKKGGFKIGKIRVKNGDETILEVKGSIANDGTVKAKASAMGEKVSTYVDQQGVRSTASSNVGTIRTSSDFAQQTGELELTHAGEQVALAKYANKGGNLTRGGATYEVADDLVTGEMYHNGHEISYIGSKDGLKGWGKRWQEEAQRQKKEIEPLANMLLRPLRERFNTAIDLFKYNGRKDFEKFVNKNELSQCVAELQDEAVKLKKGFKGAEKVSDEHIARLIQVEEDMKYAKKLIAIEA